MPVVRPEAYRDSTAWMATYMAGTWAFSKDPNECFAQPILEKLQRKPSMCGMCDLINIGDPYKDIHKKGGSPKSLASRIEGFEHDLRHALAVGFGVQRGFRQQHRVLLWGHTQLVVEGVVPDLLLSYKTPSI